MHLVIADILMSRVCGPGCPVVPSCWIFWAGDGCSVYNMELVDLSCKGALWAVGR